MKRLFSFAGMILLLASHPALPQEQILVDLHEVWPKSVAVKGFSLSSDQEISIQAVGIHLNRRHPAMASAWILNARTREVVWELAEANTRTYNRYFGKYEGTIKLPPGDYAAYYAFFAYNYGDHHTHGFGEAMAYLVGELFFDRNYWNDKGDWQDDTKIDREKFKDLGLLIRGRGQVLDDQRLAACAKTIQNESLVSLTALWDDDYKKQGFTLEQPLELSVYAIGEARHDEVYDYGWIINTQTRAKVWTFNYDASRPAGGAEKNRMVRETLKLPAGNYAAFWVTDDSHSYRRWNATPPHDPEFWGLSLAVKEPAMKKYARTFAYEEVPAKNVFLNITHVRDDEFISKGFTLKQPADVRIYALGEGRDGEMFDYGWIVDGKTRKKVWEMDYYKTEHAGGGEKNRLFDGVVHLEPGNYLAYYTSDGTHSFRDWNTSPPIDQEYWGMTLMTAEQISPTEAIAPYEEKNDDDVIAQIVNVRDNQDRQVDFRLSQNSEVRVYAVGEGRDGEMFDYGWIEDHGTNRVVWEMTFRMTEHAGGSRKNRMLNDTISLKAGLYTLRYKSDGSHSWRDWNDSPPNDPASWGITVYRTAP